MCAYQYHIKTDLKIEVFPYMHIRICQDHDKEQFRRMMHTSPGLGYGMAQLMTCISNKKHYAYALGVVAE